MRKVTAAEAAALRRGEMDGNRAEEKRREGLHSSGQWRGKNIFSFTPDRWQLAT
jgi:hypothetical protein